MSRSYLICVIFSLLAFSACQRGNLASEDPGGEIARVSWPASSFPVQDYQYIFDAPADSVDISVNFDPGLSVEASVPLEGGMLTTTGSDGTVYTLEIPPDALLNETMIKMTPASAVSGLPFGGEQTYAVQLEPEGLWFNNFVTLAIDPAAELPQDQQIPFGFKAGGQHLSLVAPVIDTPQIKLQLLHFSGAGVTKGFLADIEPVRQRLGGDVEARLQSLVAEVLGRERQRLLLGAEGSSDLENFMDDIFRQYEERVLKPRIAAAGESCAAGRLALQTFLGLERQRQLLGMGDEMDSAAINELMKTVSRRCLQEEFELCVEDHIIHRMIPVWLGLERQYQLLGMADENNRPDELAEAEELTRKCLTFELHFESDARFDDGGGGGYESCVRGEIPLIFNPEEIKIAGQAPLVSESFEYIDADPYCKTDNRRGGSTFDGFSLSYVSDVQGPEDLLGLVTDFKLTYWPGVTTESFTMECEDSEPVVSPPNGYWTGVYLMLHHSELTGGGTAAREPVVPDLSFFLGGMDGVLPAFPAPKLAPGEGYLAEGWEILGQELFAQKVWSNEDGDLGLYEAGTFKLYHRPAT